ncbi:Rne/Rng family ribonuclease [Metabacillus iocasae]|uniref:Ribonuclease G n=1 Tax=Priestia iocasae TaxID=2291674 RepID=A0ABS2QPK2_9BACI|nr:Rne/Rng family ribonuclease [Metabacillus iocasae]MBM7701372.1 ribonuclease G [Metabacillus iocasae]
MKTCVINAATTAKRMALIGENGLEHLHLEQQNKHKVVGNIYLGRVVNVVPGMQAAFIDIGLSQNGFLHRDDLASYQRVNGHSNEEKSISHFVHEGEAILVQIVKESIGTKGPKLTGLLELSTEEVVYLPHGNYIAISKKIEDEAERKKWTDYGQSYRQEQEGFLFRTAVKDKTIEAITQKLDQLRSTYTQLSQKAASVKAPALIYDAYHFIEMGLSNLLKHKVDEIIVDDFHTFESLKKKQMDRNITLTYYKEKENIFGHYQIEQEIDKLLKRVVWLKSGAYLVIDETEALTVVDVNTGTFVGKKSFRETALLVNKEAAVEVARQMRLRNIGGIVIVDFINMSSEQDRQAVIQELRKETLADYVRTTIVGFTELGLLQLTRKKVNESISTALTKPCDICSGKGRTFDDDTVVFQIERTLLEHKYKDDEAIWIETRASVIEKIKKEGVLDRLKGMTHMQLFLTPSSHAHCTYTVRQIGSEEEIKKRIKR